MRRLAATVATLAVVGAGLSACGGPSAAPAARAYLQAWSAGDDARAAAQTDDPKAAGAALRTTRARLQVRALRASLGAVSTNGSSATAAYDATLTLAGLGTWSYRGRLALHRDSGRWRVHWAPADIYPALTATTRLDRTRALPQRAPILDGSGRPLFTARPIVNVGIEPSRLHGQLAHTVGTLVRLLHVDARSVTAAVKAARPDEFVPVITLRRAAYLAVKPAIYSLPGTVFTTGTGLLPPTTGFARPLLGSVGLATADVLRAAGPGYQAGDELGLSGLQLAFQRRLAGTASGTVVVTDLDGHPKQTLKRFAGTAGRPVATTLDERVQLAAESALAHVTKPAALVAIRPSTGAILAAASTPDATSYDRALEGRYPPGSTFKVVTTYALLGRGVTPQTSIACTSSINVGGKVFRNFEGESLGPTPFARDFAASCNTAFIRASARLRPHDLADAAAAFGVGAPWRLAMPSFSGSVPTTADPVEAAADAIGQGKVEVSPLTMAVVAAAVESGTARPPVLLRDPAPPPAPPAHALDANRLGPLRSMMRLVVTSGTAQSAGLPPATYGKTGTAEFGGGPHPGTHAWFLGYRGDLAFAVLVEGGGVGGQVAAPLAARFLRLLG